MWDIGDKMAEGAALMTNTKWSSRILGAAYPQHMNKTVAETMWENIKTVGLLLLAVWAFAMAAFMWRNGSRRRIARLGSTPTGPAQRPAGTR